MKAQCLQPWDASHQYGSLCYNDIQALYQVRGVQDRTFPYVHGNLDPLTGELVDGAIEYPVLTGLFMYVSGAGVEDGNGYLKQSAVLLAPFGLLVAFLLALLEPRRALMWAAAPALVLYSFHNWDLLAAACAVGGFYAYRHERTFVAAALFGLGAAFKMYPAFFLGPLVAASLFRRDVRRGVKEAAMGAGAFVAVNLPFYVANPDGWWATYRFHQLRGPNFDDIWNLGLPKMSPEDLNLVTGVLTLVAFGIALVLGWSRAQREGSYPVVEVSAALLAGFLLVTKVHSPQYTLWLLPFFVLVRVNVLWWIAYAAADLLVYVGVFRFYYDYFERPGAESVYDAMRGGVWLRAALLLGLFIAFLRAPRSPDDPGADLTSHPLPSVSPVGEKAAVG